MGFDYLYFLRFFYRIGYYKTLTRGPKLYSRLLLLFILHTVVCIRLPHTPDLSLPRSRSYLIHTGLFSISVSVSVLYMDSWESFFRFHIQGTSCNICLSLTYFTKYNYLRVHLCYCKWQYFILFYG